MKPSPPLSIDFHPSAYPAALEERLRASLQARMVPPRFLYESSAQAGRWLAYHQAWSPSRKDESVADLYRGAFRRAAESLPTDAVVYAGLGCGAGRKDREALAQLIHDRGGQTAAVHYVPLDVSPALVLESALGAREQWPALPLHPIVADLSSAPDLREWLVARGIGGFTKLFAAFGMLPNAEPEPFTGWLASLLAPADRLLVSANLSPAGFSADRERILRQYDNAEALAWYEGALREIGADLGGGRLRVEAENLSADGSFWRIVVRAKLIEGAAVKLTSGSIQYEPGAELQLFHSNRFTFEAAQALLKRAGLRVLEAWRDDPGEEGVFFCGTGGE